MGCVILDPSCLFEAQRVIPNARVFYDLRHQMIWEALVAMGRNGGIDLITLQQYLRDGKTLDQAGGLLYITTLPDLVPSAANLSTYLEIVTDKWKQRRTIQICTEIAGRAQSFSGSIEELGWSVGADLREVERFYESDRGTRISKPSTLSKFNTQDDPNTLLGSRWLCRGGSCMIVGPSGRGKSTLNMQLAICWAIDRAFCGIRAGRPLKQLIINAENDDGDLAEMFQGVLAGMGIDPMMGDVEYDRIMKQLEENLTFVSCPGLAGQEFLNWVEDHLEANPVDLAWIDPLVAFADEDITKVEGAAKFLRRGLGRIAAKTGVCWMVIHHVPKPKQQQHKGPEIASNAQYAGAGSFDLAGWARAMVTLVEHRDKAFKLLFSKRGERAGAKHLDETPTLVLWIRHATEGICWEQVEQPEESEPPDRGAKGGRPGKVETVCGMNLWEFLNACTDGESKSVIAARLEVWLTTQGIDLSRPTCSRIIERLASNPCNKLKKLANALYVKGPNA